VDPNAGENDWETNKKHGDDSAGQLNLLLKDAGSLELGPLELTDSELGQLSEEEEQHAREKYKQIRAEEDAEVKAAAHEEEAAAKFEAELPEEEHEVEGSLLNADELALPDLTQDA